MRKRNRAALRSATLSMRLLGRAFAAYGVAVQDWQRSMMERALVRSAKP